MATEIVVPESSIVEELVEEPGQEGGPDEKRLSRRTLLARRFLRNRFAVVGLIVYILLAVLAVVGTHWGVLARWGYSEIDRGHYLEGPSGRHWFGTNQQGRDVFALTMRGLGKSMIIGLAVGVCSTTLAAVVGSFAAYFQGWFERVALWAIDLLLVMPSFIIIAILLRNTGAGSGIWLLIFFLVIFGWMLSARVVRSLTMSVRDREYVTAAKYMGVSGPRIVFRHILPNISSLLIIDATLAIAYAVLAETSLSFFGLGIRPPETSLGTLIGDGARMATTFPWVFASGAVFLVLMVVSVNLVGDGLRDALDPTSKSGGHA
jgi:glutathione transport system permease protein